MAIPAFKGLPIYGPSHEARVQAWAWAKACALANGAPVAIWQRDDGSCVVCEEPPDEIEPDPKTEGWVLWAICTQQAFVWNTE